jgi:DoxX-like family
MSDGVYVEVLIKGSMDELWNKTQEPSLHRQWDLRFTDIEYLPKLNENEPQQFVYATRIGLGLAIRGKGETTGTRDDDAGSRMSSLKFWSDNPISLISEGSGYWKYIPSNDDIRFLTWYDYKTRFGIFGKLLDAVIFRPLMGWATAWSFDCLRKWIEETLPPNAAIAASCAYFLARASVAFVWVYHGLIPKVIFKHHDELAMFVQSGMSPEAAGHAVLVAGIIEIVFGFLVIIFWRDQNLLKVTIVLMALAIVGVALKSPGYLVAAFNPISLNLSVMALSMIALILFPYTPSARRCLRKKTEQNT